MSDLDPTVPAPSDAGTVAVAGVQPDPWAKEKEVAHAALAALLAKLNETATRDQIVDESYLLLDALPLPGFVKLILDGAKPVIKVLAEKGAK